MVKDMFGYEHPPSSCHGAAIISSSGPGYDYQVCSECGEPVREKDRQDKARRLKEIAAAKEEAKS